MSRSEIKTTEYKFKDEVKYCTDFMSETPKSNSWRKPKCKEWLEENRPIPPSELLFVMRSPNWVENVHNFNPIFYFAVTWN